MQWFVLWQPLWTIKKCQIPKEHIELRVCKCFFEVKNDETRESGGKAKQIKKRGENPLFFVACFLASHHISVMSLMKFVTSLN